MGIESGLSAAGLRGLDKVFEPRRIAVIGASNSRGSVGFTLFNNLIGGGFRGYVYPVNPFSPHVQGVTAYPSIRRIPWQVDLAVVATPAHMVPQIVEECGESGVGAVVIVSSGFRESGPEGEALEERIVKLKQEYGFRVVGPNCLGVIRPGIGLNATFAKKTARPGRIAFISQSGALCASVLDWAAQANVGFSYFVSIGGMLDVDFADLIDYFGMDPDTRSIILFIEAIKDPRKFMSSARRFAGTKPIIVVKSGKSPEGSRAAASHTGAITGEDIVYDSFFKRAGIVRVEKIADLFNCSEILDMQPSPRGPRLTIITNAGGPSVMAVDTLSSVGGRLAGLSGEMIQKLDGFLPSYWSKSNPVDIGEDATVDRFKVVLETCFKSQGTDGFLVIYTPIGAADPVETASVLIEVSQKTRKPILTSWLGEEDVREARGILRRNRIPTCPTPEQAVETFMYMYQHRRNLEFLYETPEELPLNLPGSWHRLREILKKAKKEGREVLTEPESKEFLEAYGIPTAKAHIARSQEEAAAVASKIGYPVVMKILSPQVTHKTDVDGVILNIFSDSMVERCFQELVNRAQKHRPSIEIEGVTVEPMVLGGYELIMGSKREPKFGSVIVFGSGGVGVELFQDLAVGFPPLNQTLSRRMMEQTKAYEVLSQGFRGRPPADLRRLEEVITNFSQLIVDYPEIKEVDVNPLLADVKGIIALDARLVVDLNQVEERQQRQHLIVSPYPMKYVKKLQLKDGGEVLLRPINPEDEPFLVELFNSFSEDTMMLRFFQAHKDVSHRNLSRFCNIDYDREMNIVSETVEDGERRLTGMVSLIVEPDGETGEVAVVVGDPWQGRGLGSGLFDYIIEVARDMGLRSMFGEVLKVNRKMLKILESRGFQVKPIDRETCRATLNLKTEED